MQPITQNTDNKNQLPALEHTARGKIESATTPYIGLIPDLLDHSAQEYIINALRGAGGKFGNLETGLKKFPALFLSYIVTSLKKSLGAENKNSVYECLNVALSQPRQAHISQNDKEILLRAFRRACQKLELPVSNRLFGPNYMVDTYHEQSGVSETHLDKVWERMTTFARRNGLPDEYDLNAQQAWYARFCASLNPPFSNRHKRALENDATGYYLQQFYLIVAKDMEKTPEAQRFQDAALPSLLFDGDGLTLIFFATQHTQTWTLNTGGDNQRIETGTESRNIDLDDFSIKDITVTSSSGMETTFTLWRDDRNNQFVIFDADTHHFISSHSLMDDGVVLNPGRYRILSRFAIEDNWLQTAETLEEDFHWGEFQLDAGKKQTIQKGPASFIISAHSHAVLELNGPVITPYEGTAFYSSDTLSINAKLPEEWELGAGEYELVFRLSQSDQERSIAITFIEKHQVSIPLAFVSGEWNNTVDRLNISLRRAGQKRPLARASCIVWFGLQALQGGFKPECSALPDNLSKDHSENIRIIPESQSLEIQDLHVPFVTLGFKLKHRVLTIKFALPGTYIYLDDPHAEVRRETLISEGTTLSASYQDRRRIRIYSTECGILKLGNLTLHDDFAKKPWVRHSIAALVDHIEGENNSLTFVALNYSKPLVKLVSPHNISEWQVKTQFDSIDISFTTPSPVHTVTVAATELLSNRYISEQFDANEVSTLGSQSTLRGMLISNDQPPYQQHLPINCSGLTDGFWFVQISAKIHGRWGVLSNERKDQYALMLNIQRGQIKPYSNTLLAHIEPLNTLQKNQLLQKINNILRTCFEKSCWDSIYWLKNLWLHLINSADVVHGNNIKNILPFTEALPDENASPSWVPLLHIGGFNPAIYTANARDYRKIDTGTSINLRCFKGINKCYRDMGDALRKELITDAVVCAFSNKNEVMSATADPVNFSLESLSLIITMTNHSGIWETLRRDQREPALGELLGSYHLSYCQHDVLTHLRRTQNGNDYLRPAMLSLAYRCQDADTYTAPNLVPLDYFEYEREAEVLQEISCLASALAKACRAESRGQHTLEPLLNRLRQDLLGDSQDISSVLSFFLNVAGSLFHYYLLLWEVSFISRDK